MTTIAWDGTTLAADQGDWSGGVRRRVCKVFKVQTKDRGTLLAACAGPSVYCIQVLDWIRGERERPNPADFHDRGDMSRQCALVIDSERRVWQLSNHLHWEHMQESIFAFGAGQEFAWGALEAGASAVRAIEITAKRSDYAAFGVDFVRFDDEPVAGGL